MCALKTKLLFVISQLYKGGAEVSLVNLLKRIDQEAYEIELMVMNQCPVEGAVNLISTLPEYIKVVDIYQQEQVLSLRKRIGRKFLCSLDDISKYPLSALLYARQHEYDWAFHIGEWWMPDFVATKVRATHKIAWIHNDLSEAEYFDADTFFQYDDVFEKYIFVSKRSLESSAKKYQFLKNKSVCIYNINDARDIRMQAGNKLGDMPPKKGLTVLTCANVRKQKNHLRQLKAMKILRERGVEFTWWNIGSTADITLVEEVSACAREYGLEDSFLLLGSKANPYQYMAQADIVAVLSDYESWSMVITEAKILGIPVIATKTSGALEQIEDGTTGILTDFNAEDIADKLETLITTETLRRNIRNNIKNFDNTEEILAEFYNFLNYQNGKVAKKRILYIIDDVNYQGGAHIATKSQIRALLKENQDVTIFSGALPAIKIRNELPGVKFIGWQQCEVNQLYHRRLMDCLTDSDLTGTIKAYKLRMTWESKVKKNPRLFDQYVKSHLSELFSQYEIICVMSEGSIFRNEVAAANSERKIQYIHTDYVSWSRLSDWTREVTSNDEDLYKHFDKIVLLTDNIRDRFAAMYPSLKEKTVVNQNLMPVAEIRKKAIPPCPKGELVRFVTVGRIDFYKGFDRVYNALESLYEEGYQFYWTIIGDGENYDVMKAKFSKSPFSNCVKMIGAVANPFPFIKEADVFALFSRYEGLPNTIYEALILGVPVIATNVGGISSQIHAGENGWLVENDEKSIRKGLEHIFLNTDEIIRYKENLKNYAYNNEAIQKKTDQILGLDKSEKI